MVSFQFQGLADFLAMDGHGIYVWISYGIAFAVMSWLLASPLLRHRRIGRELAVQQLRTARQQASQVNRQEGL